MHSTWTLCKVPSWESTLLICILILDDINLPMGFLAVFSFLFFNIIIIPFAAVLVNWKGSLPLQIGLKTLLHPWFRHRSETVRTEPIRSGEYKSNSILLLKKAEQGDGLTAGHQRTRPQQHCSYAERSLPTLECDLG